MYIKHSKNFKNPQLHISIFSMPADVVRSLYHVMHCSTYTSPQIHIINFSHFFSEYIALLYREF